MLFAMYLKKCTEKPLKNAQKSTFETNKDPELNTVCQKGHLSWRKCHAPFQYLLNLGYLQRVTVNCHDKTSRLAVKKENLGTKYGQNTHSTPLSTVTAPDI